MSCGKREYKIIEDKENFVIKARAVEEIKTDWQIVDNIFGNGMILMLAAIEAGQTEAVCSQLATIPLNNQEPADTTGGIVFNNYKIFSSSVGGSMPNAKIVPGATVEMDIDMKNNTKQNDSTFTIELSTGDKGIIITTGSQEYRNVDAGKTEDHRFRFTIDQDYNKNAINFNIKGTGVGANMVTTSTFSIPVELNFKPNLTVTGFGEGKDAGTIVQAGAILNPTFAISNSGSAHLPSTSFNYKMYVCYGENSSQCPAGGKNFTEFSSGTANTGKDGMAPGDSIHIVYNNFKVKESKNLYFIVKIDTENSVNEVDENDNLGGPYEVQTPYLDSVWDAGVQILKTEQNKKNGGKDIYYKIHHIISNTGEGNAPFYGFGFEYIADLIEDRGSCSTYEYSIKTLMDGRLGSSFYPINPGEGQDLYVDFDTVYDSALKASIVNGKSYKVRIRVMSPYDHNNSNNVACGGSFSLNTDTPEPGIEPPIAQCKKDGELCDPTKSGECCNNYCVTPSLEAQQQFPEFFPNAPICVSVGSCKGVGATCTSSKDCCSKNCSDDGKCMTSGVDGRCLTNADCQAGLSCFVMTQKCYKP